MTVEFCSMVKLQEKYSIANESKGFKMQMITLAYKAIAYW